MKHFSLILLLITLTATTQLTPTVDKTNTSETTDSKMEPFKKEYHSLSQQLENQFVAIQAPPRFLIRKIIPQKTTEPVKSYEETQKEKQEQLQAQMDDFLRAHPEFKEYRYEESLKKLETALKASGGLNTGYTLNEVGWQRRHAMKVQQNFARQKWLRDVIKKLETKILKKRYSHLHYKVLQQEEKNAFGGMFRHMTPAAKERIKMEWRKKIDDFLKAYPEVRQKEVRTVKTWKTMR